MYGHGDIIRAMTDDSDITRLQIALRLPESLMAGVDERAKALGISRNQWFENMTDWCLRNTTTIASRE